MFSINYSMNIRIRGIYATALTYLFIKDGFKVVQQTPQIAERFGMTPVVEPADVTVKDGEDKGEIVSIGADIYSFMRTVFRYSPVWKSPVKLYSVIRPEECKFMGYVVEPCLDEGLVIKPPVEGKIILTAKRAVSKDAMVWRGEGKTFFSEHIRDEDRIKLLSISIPYNKKGYNVKWRSNAPLATVSQLKEELESLIMRYESDDFRNQGEDFIRVLLSLEDKLFLDGIRSMVVKTMKFHHMLKYSYTHNEVDIEEAKENPDPTPLIDKLANNFLKIEHVKPDGRKILLRGGYVIYKETKPDYYLIRLKRTFEGGGGKYDSLDIPIDEGDYDIVEFDSRNWYQIHKYYSKYGNLKGVYVNISTPPEILRDKIRYIDLEVDVVKKGDRIEAVDLEELERVKNVLGEKLYEKALKTVEEVKKLLS
jgi:hypothetical protein